MTSSPSRRLPSRQSSVVAVLATSLVALSFAAACRPSATPADATDGGAEPDTVGDGTEPLDGSDAVRDAVDDTGEDSTDGAPEVDGGAPEVVRYGHTYVRADGNRHVGGASDLREVQPAAVPLSDTPAWIAGVSTPNGSVWAVVDEDGESRAVRIEDGEPVDIDLSPASLPSETPPLLRYDDRGAGLLAPSTPEASRQTPPMPLEDGARAVVHSDGALVVRRDGAEVDRFELDALPDARILSDGRGQLLLLGGATDRYDHGVLGDGIEAGQIHLLGVDDQPAVEQTIELPGDTVVEGIAPIWADVTGDGAREIVVTVSDADQGARIVLFDQNGERVATGPSIGQGFRWRHQLAVAPFGPEGQREIVDVRTPHIGGTVEFFELEGDSLSIVATVDGYSSHDIGSRNLDLAVAGDVDADGQTELVVPTESRGELGVLARTTDGAETDWRIPMDGTLSTNIAAVSDPDGDISLAAATDDELLVWSR